MVAVKVNGGVGVNPNAVRISCANHNRERLHLGLAARQQRSKMQPSPLCTQINITIVLCRKSA